MTSNDIYISNNLDEFALNYQNTGDDCFLIILCNSGRMQVELNQMHYELNVNDLLLCTPDFLVGNYMHTPDFSCDMIAIRPHSLDEAIYLCIREDNRWWEKAQYLSMHPILHLTERQMALIKAFRQLRSLYTDYEVTPARKRTINIISQACVSEMLSWIEELISPQKQVQAHSHKEVIFRRFVELLTETHGTQREVQWFASQLAITPKYLSRICHSVGGTSASSIINRLTAQEIKRLLQTTDLTAKEICSQLEFNNLSFFCKYVKRNLGMSVNQYRKQHR